PGYFRRQKFRKTGCAPETLFANPRWKELQKGVPTMRIHCGYKIGFNCLTPTPMVVMLNVHPDRESDLETPDVLSTTPGVRTRSYTDRFGNRCTRLLAPAGQITLSSDFIIHDNGDPDPVLPDARLAEIDNLPDDVLQYLISSR